MWCESSSILAVGQLPQILQIQRYGLDPNEVPVALQTLRSSYLPVLSRQKQLLHLAEGRLPSIYWSNFPLPGHGLNITLVYSTYFVRQRIRQLAVETSSRDSVHYVTAHTIQLRMKLLQRYICEKPQVFCGFS